MQVEFKESFVKDLRNIDLKTVNKLNRVIEQIKQVESLSFIPNVKKLKSTEQVYYRIKVSNYRIGIRFESSKVVFKYFNRIICKYIVMKNNKH